MAYPPLCVINCTSNVFGSSLKVAKWEDIIKRKEYFIYKKRAEALIVKLIEASLHCPDIYISENKLILRYTFDNKYVTFVIPDIYDMKYTYGDGTELHIIGDYTKNTSLKFLSNFLYSQLQRSTA